MLRGGGGGRWHNSRERASLVLEPVLWQGSSGLGARCGAGGHWEVPGVVLGGQGWGCKALV